MTKKMLRVQLAIPFLMLLVFASCLKENRCIRQNETRKHLVDPSEIVSSELRDTLEKYPNLQVTRKVGDEETEGMHCNIYYEDLLIFTEKYRLFKSNKYGTVRTYDTIPVFIDLDLQEQVSKHQALEVARTVEDFGSQCVRCQLGIADVGIYTSLPRNSYRLVWKVESRRGNIHVMLDAHMQEIYFHYNHP